MRTIEEIFAQEDIEVSADIIRTPNGTLILQGQPVVVSQFEVTPYEWTNEPRNGYFPFLWFAGGSAASFWAFFNLGPERGFPWWSGYVFVAGLVLLVHAYAAFPRRRSEDRKEDSVGSSPTYGVDVETGGTELRVFQTSHRVEADDVRLRIEETMLEGKGH